MEAKVKDIDEACKMVDNLAEHGATEIRLIRQSDGSYIVRWTIETQKHN